MMKTIIKLLAVVMMVAILCISFVGCVEDTVSTDNDVKTDSTEAVERAENTDNKLGDYSVEIKSARLAEDYEGNPIVIVTYEFTNNEDEDGASFSVAFDDKVFQNGVECKHEYFIDDSANYNSDNQSKDIRVGTTLDVEVAYSLNDTTTPIEVEVSELISFSDKVIKKSFNLQ